MPLISDYPRLGIRYNVHLSDGRKFLNAELLGSVEQNDASFTFAGYDGMLVLRQESGKKAYIKTPSVRCIGSLIAPGNGGRFRSLFPDTEGVRCENS